MFFRNRGFEVFYRERGILFRKNMDMKMSIVVFFTFRMRVCIYDHMWI
jgi:hypothetical protein